jgi:hypothetical protein
MVKLFVPYYGNIIAAAVKSCGNGNMMMEIGGQEQITTNGKRKIFIWRKFCPKT